MKTRRIQSHGVNARKRTRKMKNQHVGVKHLTKMKTKIRRDAGRKMRTTKMMAMLNLRVVDELRKMTTKIHRLESAVKQLTKTTMMTTMKIRQFERRNQARTTTMMTRKRTSPSNVG